MADALADVDLHAAVWARFDAIANVNTYDGAVPATPPLDDDGGVHAYAVLWMSPGARRASTLGGRQGQLLGSCDATCVGADIERTLWCVSKVRSGLPGVITVGGKNYRLRLREDDPGAPKADQSVKPPRFKVLLELQVFIP